jgi:3,4-dihydroxy 2-butanone 4-phosphate synthase/GTP cyclohydrolase II
LEGYGLEIIEQVPIRVRPNPHNAKYLETKRQKLGHMLQGGRWEVEEGREEREEGRKMQGSSEKAKC